MDSNPGAGKTTLALRFLREDVRNGEPVVMLARDRQPPPAMGQVLARLRNVPLLHRPVSAQPMPSAVRAALRARERQAQIHDQLPLQERPRAESRDGDCRKDEFLATLAHELRNPLAPLRTRLAVLRAIPTPDRRFPSVRSG